MLEDNFIDDVAWLGTTLGFGEEIGLAESEEHTVSEEDQFDIESTFTAPTPEPEMIPLSARHSSSKPKRSFVEWVEKVNTGEKEVTDTEPLPTDINEIF